jgi:hypothetical protein
MKKLALAGILILTFFTTQAQDVKKELNTFMNNWHQAAATANEELFFGSMTDEGIYLGTDKTEKWTRNEMMKWAQPYFERDTAWAFTTISRDIYLSDDGNTAWFNEKLDTWMGVCKGTGILVKQSNGWKIALYDLSVTVDNELIQDFIKLVEGED